MAFDQKPDSRMGYRAEFCNAAGNTAQVMTCDNEDAWNLGRRQLRPFHGLAHTFGALSALIDPCTETMTEIAYTPLYQGNMEFELLVVSIENSLDALMKGYWAFNGDHEITPELISNDVYDAFLSKVKDAEWIANRDLSYKATLYYAAYRGHKPHELRHRWHYDDDDIFEKAQNAAKKRGDARPWRDWFKDGDFVEIQGERFHYYDMRDLASDPAYKILAERVGRAIFNLKDRIMGARSEFEVTSALTGADILEAIKLGSNIPHNPYFEARFYGREEICDDAPVRVAE